MRQHGGSPIDPSLYLGNVLIQGKHTMHVDHRVFGPTCGLLPFAAQVGEAPSPAATRIWTSGLEWNLSAYDE